MKFPAPALEKGVRALRTLIGVGPMNLETLAEETTIPKASLYRIMKTLVSINLAGRNPETKEYRSLVQIVPSGSRNERSHTLIIEALRSITMETGRTSEWYIPHRGRMIITERYEPKDMVVQVRARIGFERALNRELEAVTRIALAHLKRKPAYQAHWVFEKGKKRKLSRKIIDTQIAKAGLLGCVMDEEYNSNGVRRYAAAVADEYGFVGVLAIAENFTPAADEHKKKFLHLLKHEADKLMEDWRSINSSQCTV